MDRRSGHLRTAAVLALCGVFCLLALGLALLGGGVYRSVAAEADGNYTRRTALGYLVNQIRRCDVEGGVAVGRFGDGDALFLTQEEGGVRYTTCLYVSGGALRELYAEGGTLSGFAPDDGVEILPLASLTVARADGAVTMTAADADGVGGSVTIAPHCGAGEAAA